VDPPDEAGAGAVKPKLPEDLGFEYFRGPADQMLHLDKHGQEQCSYCGMLAWCFNVEGYDSAAGHLMGCANCLRVGKFRTSHNTEIGYVSDDLLLDEHFGPRPLPVGFSPAAAESLCRTPQYVGCQEGVWLVHCRDFMAYLGYWQPDDFRRHAADRNGRKLYIEMTVILPGEHRPLSQADMLRLEQNRDFIWPSDEPDRDEWGGMLYYAFVCRHCGVLRGYYDCD
jgi:hypothetical protein